MDQLTISEFNAFLAEANKICQLSKQK
jgi:hypothetical protein